MSAARQVEVCYRFDLNFHIWYYIHICSSVVHSCKVLLHMSVCVCVTGTLTLEEFKRVYDVTQRPEQEQSRRLQGQVKQRSKHTWLYQGLGAHHVLQTLRKRYLHHTHTHSLRHALTTP